MNKKILLLLAAFITLSLFAGNTTKKLRFAFMTDIHLNKNNDNDRYNGLLQALEKVKQSNVEFIVIGGDVVDVSGMGKATGKHIADSL